jgi:hypothetical protein
MVQADVNLEGELRPLEECHLRAGIRSSAAAIGALLADEFVEFGSSGRILDRAATIELLSKHPALRFRIDAFVAHPLALGAALTTYRLSEWSVSESQARVTLRSSVWVHRDGRWLLVFHQGTEAGGGAA